MAEKFRFFDAVQDEFGQYDREYNAQEFTDYFKALVTTGIMKGAGNELKVTANGSNMITKVDTGIAFLLGRYYENDSFKDLTHDTETLGNSRIDRIVVRMDLSTDARYVKTFIKKGVPNSTPVAPTLTQTQQLYEISLAQILVVGGQTFIATNAVTDERGKDIICPWAGSKILPNFDAEGLEELISTIENLENEIQLPLLNDWKAPVYDTQAPLTIYKDAFGIVHIQGTVLPGNTSLPIALLPEGYRPTRKRINIPCLVFSNNANQSSQLIVGSDGNIYTSTLSISSLTVSGSFRTT